MLGLLFDPIFATSLVLASVSAAVLFRKRSELTKGLRAALFALLALTALVVLFFLVMALLFGPVPADY